MNSIRLLSILLALAAPLAPALADVTVPPAFQGFTYIESPVSINGSPLHQVLGSAMNAMDPGALIFAAPDGHNVFARIDFGLMTDGTYAFVAEEDTEQFEPGSGFYMPSAHQQFEGTWTASPDGTQLVLDYFGTLTAVKDTDGKDAADFAISRDLITPGLAGKTMRLKPTFSDVAF